MQDVLQQNAYENCSQCDSPLKKVRHLRTSPKICNDCRGLRQSHCSKLREVYLEGLKHIPLEIDPLEDVFLDDPRALTEDNLPFRRHSR